MSPRAKRCGNYWLKLHTGQLLGIEIFIVRWNCSEYSLQYLSRCNRRKSAGNRLWSGDLRLGKARNAF
jgi:hypothetical protein